MQLIPQIPDPYLASLVLGLMYGLTLCTSVCLPYIVSYIGAIGAGFRKGVIVSSIYNSGRVIAYAMLGGLAGIFKGCVNDTFFLAYQKYFFVVSGVVILLVGISILLRKKSFACSYIDGKHENLGISKKLTQNFDIRAFSMGFTRGFMLCPPLIALLLYSVAFFSPVECVILASSFGLGTALSPLLLLGGVTGWLLNKAPSYRGWISKISGVILILLGFDLLLRTITMVNS